MWLRRTQTKLPCFYGSEVLAKVAARSKAEQLVAGTLLPRQFGQQRPEPFFITLAGRLSIDTRQGHLGLWATYGGGWGPSASTMGRLVERRMFGRIAL